MCFFILLLLYLYMKQFNKEKKNDITRRVQQPKRVSPGRHNFFDIKITTTLQQLQTFIISFFVVFWKIKHKKKGTKRQNRE